MTQFLLYMSQTLYYHFFTHPTLFCFSVYSYSFLSQLLNFVLLFNNYWMRLSIIWIITASSDNTFLVKQNSTQPRPQVFSVNGSIICNFAALLTSSVQYGKILPSLVDSNWLRRIVCVILSNQKWRNTFNNNDYYCIVTSLLSTDNSQKRQGSVVLWTSEVQGANIALWFLWKKLGFSSRPSAKVKYQGPLGSARAQVW